MCQPEAAVVVELLEYGDVRVSEAREERGAAHARRAAAEQRDLLPVAGATVERQTRVPNLADLHLLECLENGVKDEPIVTWKGKTFWWKLILQFH